MLDLDWGLALGGAGVAAQTFGAFRSAAAQKAALQYQASVARNNAQIAQDQAVIAQLNGQSQQVASELKTAATMGDQRAVAAANGVDLGVGSPTELLASTKAMGNVDALTIRDNAARQAWAAMQSAKGYNAEADMDSATAGAVSPFSAAVGSMLSSAGTVASSWYKNRRATQGAGSGGGSGIFSSMQDFAGNGRDN